MYLDSFWISAYQLTWNGGYMLVSLRISQTRTVLLNVDCVRCNFTGQPPHSHSSILVVQTNTELCLMSLKTWLYLYLLGHPSSHLSTSSFWRMIPKLKMYLNTTCTANPDVSLNTSDRVQFRFYFYLFFLGIV